MSCGSRIERDLENNRSISPSLVQNGKTRAVAPSNVASGGSGVKEKEKVHKSAGARVFGLIKAFIFGFSIQIFGAILDKFIWIETLPGSSVGLVSMLFTFLGFAAMAYFAYKWAIR